jgi:glucuronoarabinoxylan endo-1,4-beta-xylanase
MFGRPILVMCVLPALALMLLACAALPGTAVVNWTDAYQMIDGFGGSCADFYEPLSSKMADFFFTTSGIGLSLLRIQVIPSVAECRSYLGRDAGECLEVGSGATILKGELAIAKQAVSRGVTVWSTPWSPPASMKSNGSFINGGSLLPADYAAWADSLAGYVKLLNSNGVPIYAMSVQNEPDLKTSYGSATYSGKELHDFVPILHSALEASGFGRTKVMIAEASQWDFSLTDAAMADPAVARDVGVLAAHGYGSTRILAPMSYDKHVWQTEVSSQSSMFDGSIEDALSWASKIHAYLTVAQVNAWHWWFLSDGPKHGNGADNSALTDINLNYAKRTYMTGQWSKFVRPGWFRIGVSYSGSLQITAFKDPAGQAFAIVAVNSSPKAMSQAFSLNGFAADSVTPWITSASLSLAVQPPAAVKGSDFTYRLPASSVTTFSGLVRNARN